MAKTSTTQQKAEKAKYELPGGDARFVDSAGNVYNHVRGELLELTSEELKKLPKRIRERLIAVEVVETEKVKVTKPL